ncbi:MAG TPA: DUF222 domain-containing protein [Galbitalea sp.]|jgi:hypothetical protein
MSKDLLDYPAIAVAMTGIDGGPQQPFDVIDVISMLDNAMNRLAGLRAEAIEIGRRQCEGGESLYDRSLADRSLAARSYEAEIACALRISERAAQNLVGTGATLAAYLPSTLVALSNGEISYRHAQIMVEQTAGLSAEATSELESTVLERAKRCSPPRFTSVVRKARERRNPESIHKRHELAVADRTISLDPDRDGMSWLSALLPSAQAAAIFDKLTSGGLALARTAKSRGDERTLAQYRVDLFAMALLQPGEVDSSSGAIPPEDDSVAFARWFRGIRAEVVVTVPVLSLVGRDTAPAELDGYGPIDLHTARILVGRAKSFVRLLTHPETGAGLSVGRKRYKVPKDLRTWLRVRDGTCRFPGCGRSSMRCDLDHNEEWQYGGWTDHDNLANFCRWHHTLKSGQQWKVLQAKDGSGELTWTSPTGRNYVTIAETQVAPAR